MTTTTTTAVTDGPATRPKSPVPSEFGRGMGNQISFALVFCVVNLHALMNLSAPLYLLAYLGVSAWVLQRAVRTRAHRRLRGHGLLFFVWVGVALMAGFTSLGVISPAGAVYGTVRFLFAAPVFVALTTFTETCEDLVGHVRTMVLTFMIAALTLPLQFLTGPISWFDEPSIRGTEIRYASLVGSLTSIGIAVGCYLVLAAALRRNVIIVAALTSVAAALSLSKAAIANIIIGWALILFFNRHRPIVLLAAGLGAPLAAVAAYVAVPGLRTRVDTVLGSFGIQSEAGATNYDANFIQSIVDRLTDFPAANWAALDDFGTGLVYLSGGGYGMGDTALVALPDVTGPMAHNQLIESMSVFGLVGGTIQWLVLLCIGAVLISGWRRTGNRLIGITAVAFGVLLLNSALANGSYYQPATASVLYFAMFVAQHRIVLEADPEGPGTTPQPAQRKRGIRMQLNEIVAAVLRRWITFVVVGLIVGGALFFALSSFGSQAPDSSTSTSSASTVALAPSGDSVAELSDSAALIDSQVGYWAQLASSDAVLSQIDADLDVDIIRGECVLATATNVWSLSCTPSGGGDSEEYVERWSAALQKEILASTGGKAPPVEFRNIGDVESSTGLTAAAGANIAVLALPVAVLTAAGAALFAALAHDRLARRKDK